MPIVRITKRKHPYVQIDKRPLEDERLTWKAKGLIAYLLSRPDDWRIYIEQLKNASHDGRVAVQSALRELSNFGYARLGTVRENNRAVGKEWIVFEHPSLTDGFSVSQQSLTDRKSTTTNKEKSNKKSTSARAEKIYAAYPYKVGHPKAIAKIEKALSKLPFASLLARTRQFAALWAGVDKEFCPLPATWFHQERYNDDPSTWKPRHEAKAKTTQRKTTPQDYSSPDA